MVEVAVAAYDGLDIGRILTQAAQVADAPGRRDPGVEQQAAHPAALADLHQRGEPGLSQRGVSRARLEGSLVGKPGLKRFLRVTPGGLLRIDKAKANAEANLDGKYLLRSSDPALSAEDIALGHMRVGENRARGQPPVQRDAGRLEPAGQAVGRGGGQVGQVAGG